MTWEAEKCHPISILVNRISPKYFKICLLTFDVYILLWIIILLEELVSKSLSATLSWQNSTPDLEVFMAHLPPMMKPAIHASCAILFVGRKEMFPKRNGTVIEVVVCANQVHSMNGKEMPCRKFSSLSLGE